MYGNTPRRGSSDPLTYLRKSYIPVTLILIGVNVVAWFLAAILRGASPFWWLSFDTLSWPVPRAWSFVTWPLVGAGHPLSFLFACLWFFQIGGSLERSWGSRPYAFFLAAVSALTAVSLWVGAKLLGQPAALVGLWHAVAAPTVAWAVINRREMVNLYFVPVPAFALAGLAAVILWYEIGPILGLFALAGCAAAYWYAAKGRYSFGVTRKFENERPLGRGVASSSQGRAHSAPGQNGFNPLRWWKERQERKRLEAIFRRSGFTDDDERR